MSEAASTSTVQDRKAADTRRRDAAAPAPRSPVGFDAMPFAAAGIEPAVSTTGGTYAPADLDRLSSHWRVVFDAAEDALRAATRCGRSLRFPPAELHERAGRLTRERTETAVLLDAIAGEEHVRLDHRLSSPRVTRRMLGLPPTVRACVFDLEGVLAGSARLHAAAWAETLDAFLSRRVEETGERFAPYRPFDPSVDYERHIQGKPRLDGVLAFLASRGIRLPDGSPADPAGAETVWGLATRKNEALLRHLDREGVSAFAGARAYLEGAREAGLRCAVVTASANTTTILERAGLAELVDERIDAASIEAGALRSKPEPDTVLAACARLGVHPANVASLETTFDGVEAARNAGVGLVIAIDRRGKADALRAHGAGLVVPDLTGLLDRRITA